MEVAIKRAFTKQAIISVSSKFLKELWKNAAKEVPSTAEQRVVVAAEKLKTEL